MKTRFENWCDFNLNELRKLSQEKRIPIDNNTFENVAKGLVHLVMCDHLYQMRENEQYWQKCIDQLLVNGEGPALLSNSLFILYTESDDEMQHSQEEKKIIKGRTATSKEPLDIFFWTFMEFIESTPTDIRIGQLFISSCSSICRNKPGFFASLLHAFSGQ